MLRFSLISLFSLFVISSYGQTESNKAQLEAEKSLLQQKIDSLQARINAIDQQLLRELSPEERLTLMIDKYGKKKGPMIADGRVWPTINQEMALDSWGEPDKRQKSESTLGVTETWYYPGGKYIYFENGRVSSWRE
jgi:hypothetical protein